MTGREVIASLFFIIIAVLACKTSFWDCKKGKEFLTVA